MSPIYMMCKNKSYWLVLKNSIMNVYSESYPVFRHYTKNILYNSLNMINTSNTMDSTDPEIINLSGLQRTIITLLFYESFHSYRFVLPKRQKQRPQIAFEFFPEISILLHDKLMQLQVFRACFIWLMAWCRSVPLSLSPSIFHTHFRSVSLIWDWFFFCCWSPLPPPLPYSHKNKCSVLQCWAMQWRKWHTQIVLWPHINSKHRIETIDKRLDAAACAAEHTQKPRKVS